MIKGIYYRWTQEEKFRKVKQFLRIKNNPGSIHVTLIEYTQNIGISKSVFLRWIKEYKEHQKTKNEIQEIME